MPLYKVTLSKRTYAGNTRTFHNPFTRRLPDNLLEYTGWLTHTKVWEFHAESEDHVTELYNEAVSTKINNVSGFELTRIEEIK